VTLQEILDRCFDRYGFDIKNIWSCRCCGSLVPTDRREMHLEFHHPDRTRPVMLAGRVDYTEPTRASWKQGILPDWARFD
jgi:hypothetical protein